MSEVVTNKENDQIGIPSEHKRLIQLVYDRFAETGQWPKSRNLQIAYIPGEFWSVVDEINHHLLTQRGEKSDPSSQTILSLEGIALCSGSERHLSLFIRSLQACVEIYAKDPENPTIKATDLQESLSITESESHCAMGLLFIGYRIWSSASGSPKQQVTELKLNPDVLTYSGVTHINQYIDIVRRNRPRISENCVNHRQTIELKNAFLKTFDSLHPEIANRCEELYRNEHYSESVEASFKIVRDRLRHLTGYERGQDAFGKGNLHIAGASAAHVDRDFNEGVKFLLMAIDRFRNEKSHTSNDQINDPTHAYEYLRMSSLAMRFLDRADALPPKDI